MAAEGLGGCWGGGVGGIRGAEVAARIVVIWGVEVVARVVVVRGAEVVTLITGILDIPLIRTIPTKPTRIVLWHRILLPSLCNRL